MSMLVDFNFGSLILSVRMYLPNYTLMSATQTHFIYKAVASISGMQLTLIRDWLAVKIRLLLGQKRTHRT